MKKLYVISVAYVGVGNTVSGNLITAQPIVASNDVEKKQKWGEFVENVEKFGNVVMGEHCLEIDEDILKELER